MFSDHAIILAVSLPLLFAFTIPLISKISKRFCSLLTFFILLTVEILVIFIAGNVLNKNIVLYTIGATSPSSAIPLKGLIPVRIVFEVDAMSTFIALTCTTIVFLVVIYSTHFLRNQRRVEKYNSLLLLLTSAMLGLSFTGDLFSMFVFLELLSVSSAALIVFYKKSGSFDAAFKYMIVSSVSALMFLFGVSILYAGYGSLNIALIAKNIQFSLPDKIALALLLVSFMMKCGAVPLHFWVADAYGEAPSSVSAVLVVASQVCLYALFRLSFTLFSSFDLITTIAWFIIVAGILSMFIGVTVALSQKDIKRLMAYHAISQTGYMLLGVGVGLAVINDNSMLNTFGIIAMEGGIFHIINHAFYKGLLFLTAGAIVHVTGTSRLDEMKGLAHFMPLTTIFFLVGALSITGLPPFNGFVSKLMIYESVFIFNPILAVIAMIVSMLTLASFIKVFYAAFMGPRPKDKVREVPKLMLLPMLILVILILVFGLIPDIIVDLLVKPATFALINKMKYISMIV